MRMDQPEHKRCVWIRGTRCDPSQPSTTPPHISELRMPLGVHELEEGITRKIYILEGHPLKRCVSGEHDATRASPLTDAEFLSYGRQVYQLEEGITRKIYILEGHTSTQKMRMDQGNTMRPEPALYDAAFLSYGRH